MSSLFPELDTLNEDEEKKKKGFSSGSSLFPELDQAQPKASPSLFPELDQAPPIPLGAPPKEEPGTLTENDELGALPSRPSSVRVDGLDEGIKGVASYLKNMAMQKLAGPLGAAAESTAQVMEPPKGRVVTPQQEFAAKIAKPSMGPIMGPLLETDLGKRYLGNALSTAATVTAGMTGSIPAAEAFLKKDTPVGRTMQKVTEQLNSLAEELAPEDPRAPDLLFSGGISMATFMLPGTAAAKAVSQIPRMGAFAAKLAPALGSTVSSLLESATESGGVYEDMLKKGFSRDVAAKAAFQAFWKNAIIVGITNRFGIFGDQLTGIKKALASSGLEGYQEMVQSIIAKVAKEGKDSLTKEFWLDEVLPAFGVGAVIGGGASTMMPQIKPEQKAYLDGKFPGLSETVESQPVAGTPEQSQEILRKSAAAGEEALLLTGDPAQAQAAALKSYQDQISSIEKPVSPTEKVLRGTEKTTEELLSKFLPEKPGLSDAATVEQAFRERQDIPESVLREYPEMISKVRQERAREAAQTVLKANKIDDVTIVNLVDEIVADEKAFKEGYGQEAKTDEHDFLGVTYKIPPQAHSRIQAVIELAKGATESTGRHEAFHAVSNILLDENEQNIITKKYGDIEKAADAFGDYRQTQQSTGNSIIDTVFEKLKVFLEKVGNYFDSGKFTTADELFQAIEEGRLQTKEGTRELTTQYNAVKKTEKVGLEQTAVEKFGVTDDLSRAGFVLGDGRMVNVSGETGARLEHRDVASAIYKGTGTMGEPTDLLHQFLKETGAARIVNYPGHMSIETHGPLSPDQIRQLADHFAMTPTDDATFSVVNDWGKEIRSKSVTNPTAEDVARFFNGTSQYSAVPKKPQTETPEFKKWFGDSKVVDEKGKPLVVYHGTEADFTRFADLGNLGIGHFAKHPELTNDFLNVDRGSALGVKNPRFDVESNVKPVYLQLQNPIKLPDLTSWNLTSVQAALSTKLKKSAPELVREIKTVQTSEELVRLLLENGYDGFVYTNQWEGLNLPENERESYIVFEPEQIKSATGNVGTFDPNNPDIRYSAVPKKEKAPTFYSQLQKVIEAKLPSRAMPDQIENILNSQDVKKDEVEWSGVKEWLESKKGKGSIPKEEVLEFLKQNNVQIQEVMKGDRVPNSLPFKWVQEKDGTHYVEVDKDDGLGPRTMGSIQERTGNPKMVGNFYASAGTGSMPDHGSFQTFEQAKQWVEKEVSEREKKFFATDTKFSNYTLPGGENYRELLLTLPEQKDITVRKWEIVDVAGGRAYLADTEAEAKKELPALSKAHNQHFVIRPVKFADSSESNFRSSHFSEPNILAHVRFNERVDAEGKKTLFLEEIQSDWHQLGREKGYRQEGKLPSYELKKDPLGNNEWVANIDGRQSIWTGKNEADVRAQIEDGLKRNPSISGVPNAPFKKTWHELSLKRMLRYATENGFDKVAWTTGEQQAERYDLSKKISKVEINKLGYTETLHAYDEFGNEVISEPLSQGKPLGDIIGKEAAQKLEAQEWKTGKGKKLRYKSIEGQDLKVGGEGMKGFYDKIIPEFLNKYTKKWGGRVGETEVAGAGRKTDPDGSRYTIEQSDESGMYYIQDMETDEIVDEAETERGAERKLSRLLGADPDSKAKVHSLDITPAMKESVLYQGQPQYSAEIKPSNEPRKIPEGIYEQNRTMAQTGIVSELRQDAKEARTDIGQFFDKMLGTISTRLANISPTLKYALRSFEFKAKTKTAQDLMVAERFLKKVQKMSDAEKKDFDLAQKNGDAAKLQELAMKHKFLPEYYQMRQTLNEIHKRANEVGFEVGYKMHYFPRIVQDKAGFMNYFRNTEGWSQINQAIEAKEKALNRVLTEDEKVSLINTMIRGYQNGKISLSQTGNMKDRVIDYVSPKLNRFYANSNAALVSYLQRTNEAIEARRFFGRGSKELEFNNLDDTIGAYTLDLLAKKKISPEQEKELSDILKARFNYMSTTGVLGIYKNLAYLDTLGSVSSALTQIEDMAIPLYLTGPVTAGKVLGKALAGKSEIKMADLGLDNIAEEFRDRGKLSKVMKSVFDATGFTMMDRLGKEATVNAAITKHRQQAKNPTPKYAQQLQDIFGEETEQVIQDLRNGTVSENVKLLAFNEILDIQPVALSEMPEMYLTSPNGRLFYMLKSFQVKRFDLYRNQIFKKIGSSDKSEKIEGIKNLIKLAMVISLMGATADEIKDLVFNRKTTLTDRTVDNLLKMAGFSKFTIYKARQEGLWSATTRTILPPFKFADALYKDIVTAGDDKGLETVASIPVGGKLYYWWFGKGVKKAEKERKKYEKAQRQR